MANTNPQAIYVSNNKIRPAADKMGQVYNFFKSLQSEAAAQGWPSLFPADLEVISDGSATDGRNPITDTDVSNFISMVTTFINWMEASSNANRNLTMKIAVNPERF